jgi:D-sedoheptulose 7-phosphate isomerase
MGPTGGLPIVTDEDSVNDYSSAYVKKLVSMLNSGAMQEIPKLAEALRTAWRLGKTVYLCGNGGSAANGIHLANDFLYGAGVTNGYGLKVEALSANPSVLTALANDVGYEAIFAEQIKVKANSGDLLVVFSGSGNSPNIVKALEMAHRKGMTTFAVLGYSGGRCKNIAQHAIHFDVADMQVAEDLQMIVGHICMQWLRDNPLNAQAGGAH